MKRYISIFISAIFVNITILLNAQNCVQCNGTSVSGETASAIGINTSASAKASFAGGMDSEAIGKYSFAFGDSAKAWSRNAIALGKQVSVFGAYSFGVGENVKTNSTSSMVIGIGFDDYNPLINTESKSLMIGFNSNKPTFFIGTSTGLNTTGKIGIGDVTDPQAKLHIKADNNEDADLLLEPGSSMNYARVKFGTAGNRIDARGSQDLNFHTASDFVFWDANVGIGTYNPSSKLDVSGKTTTAQLQVTQGAAANKILQSDADGNASWVDPITVGVDDGDWDMNGNNVYRLNGNVGIGTSTPDSRFSIIDNSGDIDEIFLKISNEGVFGGGTTVIGKVEGNGPVIFQQAGSVNFSNGGPKLSFIQKSNNGNEGFVIDTYTTTQGEVDYVDVSTPNSSLYFRSYNDMIFRTGETKDERMRIKNSGEVGIGSSPTTGYKLTVGGKTKLKDVEINGNMDIKDLVVDHLTVTKKIDAAEIEVKEIAEWKDGVFKPEYNLRSLREIEQYIKQHGHLPEIPSEAEVMQNGINLARMNALLLQKVEELTLYVIELEKKIDKLKNKNTK